MRFRPHRGSLLDSMSKCVKLEAPTIQAIQLHIDNTMSDFAIKVVSVEPYDTRSDLRIGWPQTCIVKGRFHDNEEIYPVGFTDQLMSEVK